MFEKVLEKKILLVIDLKKDDTDKIYEKFVKKLGYEVLEERIDNDNLEVELLKKF